MRRLAAHRSLRAGNPCAAASLQEKRDSQGRKVLRHSSHLNKHILSPGDRDFVEFSFMPDSRRFCRFETVVRRNLTSHNKGNHL